LISRPYQVWIENWEQELCFRTNNRVVRPFEWGTEWTRDWPVPAPSQNGTDPESHLRHLNDLAIAQSDEFFAYKPPTDFHLDQGVLSYTSPVDTPYPENNTVYGNWYPSHKARHRAVIVLPHWNSHNAQHQGLAKGIQKLGISALRLSLPYHDRRMPAELERADYAVSSNVGRTLHATRQAVIDTRAAIDWLEKQGYRHIGIVGTSLGSCYAFLAAAHDARLKVHVFNHCSSTFADVVWTGLSTQHIKQSLEGAIDLERLRPLWASISPVYYMKQFARWKRKSKFIYTRFDTTFLPHLSEDVVRRIRDANIPNEVVVLPCGHYTLGETPFKYIVGYHICSYFVKHL
jgi:hypothetical protein